MEHSLLEEVRKATPTADLVEVNEVAEDLIRRQAGELIAGLSNTRKEVVRRVLAQGVARGWSDTTIRSRLAEVVGLDPRRAAAVTRHRQALLDGGVPPKRAERQTKAFAARLLKDRMRKIADQEINQALMNARRLVWQGMQARGDYSPYAVRVTVVSAGEKACSICRPQNGRRRSLSRDLQQGPPFHPGCRCNEEVQDRGIEKREDVGMAITPGGRVGDASSLAKPGSKDGPRRLVNYIRMIAHALMRKGMSKGHAIATAKNTLRRWAAGGGDVSAKVQAAAAKALAEQAALDAKNKVSKADRSTWNLEDYQEIVKALEKDGQ